MALSKPLYDVLDQMVANSQTLFGRRLQSTFKYYVGKINGAKNREVSKGTIERLVREGYVKGTVGKILVTDDIYNEAIFYTVTDAGKLAYAAATAEKAEREAIRSSRGPRKHAAA